MNLNRTLRATGKKLRLVPVAIALTLVAFSSGGTAFAASASISPGSQKVCQYSDTEYAGGTLSWSGQSPFLVDFSSDGYGGDIYGYFENTSTGWGANYPQGTSYPNLYVEDAYGNAASQTASVQVASFSWCPLSPGK